MTVGGIYSCRWRELKPMNFGAAAKAVAAVSGVDDSVVGDGAGGGSVDEQIPEEVGYGRGRGRGKGRDRAGEYEMVGMKDHGADNV